MTEWCWLGLMPDRDRQEGVKQAIGSVEVPCGHDRAGVRLPWNAPEAHLDFLRGKPPVRGDSCETAISNKVATLNSFVCGPGYLRLAHARHAHSCPHACCISQAPLTTLEEGHGGLGGALLQPQAVVGGPDQHALRDPVSPGQPSRQQEALLVEAVAGHLWGGKARWGPQLSASLPLPGIGVQRGSYRQ